MEKKKKKGKGEEKEMRRREKRERYSLFYIAASHTFQSKKPVGCEVTLNLKPPFEWYHPFYNIHAYLQMHGESNGVIGVNTFSCRSKD